jgi:hypothetical protein
MSFAPRFGYRSARAGVVTALLQKIRSLTIA